MLRVPIEKQLRRDLIWKLTSHLQDLPGYIYLIADFCEIENLESPFLLTIFVRLLKLRYLHCSKTDSRLGDQEIPRLYGVTLQCSLR